MSDGNHTNLRYLPLKAGRGTPAQSLYGQIKISVTFSASGEAIYRVHTKRYKDAWSEKALYATGRKDLRLYPKDLSMALTEAAFIVMDLAVQAETD